MSLLHIYIKHIQYKFIYATKKHVRFTDSDELEPQLSTHRRTVAQKGWDNKFNYLSDEEWKAINQFHKPK